MPKVTGHKRGKPVLPASNGQATTTVQNAPSLVWQTTDEHTARLWQGNVEDALRLLPSKSVHCVMTSPPYWGLRDYGTGEWSGGSVDCNHDWGRKNEGHMGKPSHKPGYKSPFRGTSSGSAYLDQGRMSSMICLHGCGAKRIDQQIGSESTPQEFVARMVSVFSEVHRVLRDDGTLWLNLGDTYASGGGTSGGGKHSVKGRERGPNTNPIHNDLPSGNLVGIPWRVAFALQDAGWVLRSDIIWHKPSCMPESVKNRCTKAHEYLFMLTKGGKYYFDMEAIKEDGKGNWNHKGFRGENVSGDYVNNNSYNNSARGTKGKGGDDTETDSTCINKRSVWSVTNGGGYRASHFATFPPELVKPCILAGTSAHGCCAECGAPWRRVVERLGYTKSKTPESRGNKKTGGKGGPHDQGSDINRTGGGSWPIKTVGWGPGCTCYDSDNVVIVSADASSVVPCTVLDPFVGSGTTVAVALAHGRCGWGIDLSLKYLLSNAVPRIEGELLQRPAMQHLIPARRK